MNHTGKARPPSTLVLGELDPSWCKDIRDGRELGVWARAGLYYYCGGRNLFVRAGSHTRGLCAMVRLRTPLILVGDQLTHLPPTTHDLAAQLSRRRRRHILYRRRREAVDAFDLSVHNPTYIDAIGVPRGVPNQFKLADQVAAGFENLPIIAGIIPVTPNKNVDRIN